MAITADADVQRPSVPIEHAHARASLHPADDGDRQTG
jgi:hypothetical protein